LVDLRMSGVRVYGVSDFYEQVWGRVPLESLGDSWLLDSGGFQLIADRVAANLKRGIDVTLATIVLALTAPVILLAMITVWLESGSPMLFRQTRTGYRGRPYRLIKIRTMVREAERDGPRWTAPGDPRITKVGRFLRRSRIDELPQLWSVLRGEMSFVGPRPERPEFVARLRETIPYYDMRHLVKPGITGWAQVMHQYGDSVEDARIKLEFELYYIKHYSVVFDAAILLKTARVVLFGRGR
jgi:exopolysaccharide biosynthesis polyprenyl glycosylphosphotransferase